MKAALAGHLTTRVSGVSIFHVIAFVILASGANKNEDKNSLYP
jgi:hypothetical protein